jgi:hypothetical protein
LICQVERQQKQFEQQRSQVLMQEQQSAVAELEHLKKVPSCALLLGLISHMCALLR